MWFSGPSRVLIAMHHCVLIWHPLLAYPGITVFGKGRNRQGNMVCAVFTLTPYHRPRDCFESTLRTASDPSRRLTGCCRSSLALRRFSA